MIKLDIYKDIKRGIVLVEAVSVTAILLMLAGISAGIYFSVVESSKDESLKNNSQTILQTFVAISEVDQGAISFNNNGLVVYDYDQLVSYLDTYLTSSFVLLNAYPTAFTTSAIILNDYNEEYNAYYSFTYFNKEYLDRAAITSFVSGYTNIIYGQYNVASA